VKIFLTGGTGFLGSHVIRLATQAGHEVIAPFRRAAGNRPFASPDARWIEGDLERRFHEELSGCEVLVHLAAHGVLDPAPDWQQCFHANVQLSLRLWEDAIAAGVKRLIIAGSCFEYGKSGEKYDFIPPDAPLYPTGPYHASKAAATMAAIGLCYQRHVELAVLRPFHLFGTGEAPTRFWPQLVAAARSGADFAMTTGEQVRDFTPVELAASVFLDAATRRALNPGQPVIENVGTGKPTRLRDFAIAEWKACEASGKLLLGSRAQRHLEVKRYVPQIGPRV
jgi:nucleoside-diphosphate-sugar epimerase